MSRPVLMGYLKGRIAGALAALTACLLAPDQAWTVEAVTLHLRSEAKTAADWIVLGDMAAIETRSAEHEVELSQLKMFRRPMKGVARVVTRPEIGRRLRRLGVTDAVAFAGREETVEVRADLDSVSGRRLLAFAKEKLMERLASPDVRVRVEEPGIPHSVSVPGGSADDVVLRAEMKAHRVSGFVPVTVEVWNGEERLASRLLTFRVHGRARIARAARVLEPGTVLGEGDVEVSERDLATVPADAVRDPRELVGLRVIRHVGAGSMISKSAVAMPALVKKGEPVQLIARVGTVEARVVAQSKADGAEGEIVTVMNLASNRLVKARVVSEDLVEVVLP